MLPELKPPTKAARRPPTLPWRGVVLLGFCALATAVSLALAVGPPAASAQSDDAGTTETDETEARTDGAAETDETEARTDGAAETDETEAGTDGADEAEADETEAAALREGQQVYSQICSSCHQPGGTGLAGQFPPLLDNPNVDDADYVADVVINGLQGPITVLGESYDGVMPSFSTLADDEIAALTAYIKADFDAPPATGDESAFGDTGPVAGTELPALTNMGYYVAHAAAAVVALLVLGPRLFSVNDRLSVPWLDAWLKTASIVIAVYFLIIFIPNWALQQDAVAGLSRFGQDLVGTGLWTMGVAVLLAGLWYAHRESRV